MRQLVHGPYQHGKRWRIRVPRGYGENRGRYLSYQTYESAARAKRRLVAELAADYATIDSSIERYYSRHLRATYKRDRQALQLVRELRAFFGDALLARPIDRLTTADVRRCYQRQVERTQPATHHGRLRRVRTFLRWAVAEDLISDNPALGVKPVGKARKGKPQLMHSEAQALYRLCCDRAAAGDDGALATLLALALGMRAGEILALTVRDIEPDGSALWIRDGKTDSSCGELTIPAISPVRALLVQWCADRIGLLFPNRAGKARSSEDKWLRRQVSRLCKLAQVPVVSVHALRGQFCTTAFTRGGAAAEQVAAAFGQCAADSHPIRPEQVAAAVGHADRGELARQHYVDRAELQNATTAARLIALEGGNR